MPNYPFHQTSLGLIIIPIVFLFVFLFNAYRLGLFKRKTQNDTITDIERKKRSRILILCGVVFILATVTVVLFILRP